MAEERWIWNKSFQLPNVGTGGSFPIDIPRQAEFMAVMNSSSAQIAISQGSVFAQSPDAILTEPYVFMGFPISKTQKLTLHWSAASAPSFGNDTGVIIFSNEPIIVSGGPVKTGGVASNVTVLGTATVAVSSLPSVAVSSMPQVVVQQMSELVAGSAHIGEVAVNAMPVVHVIGDSMPNPPNMDATISSLVTAVNAVTTAANTVTAAVNTLKAAVPLSGTVGITAAAQIAVGTTATVIFNAVVTGKQIAITNTDASNKLFVGPVGVTITTGHCIMPGASFTMDVVSGSTVVIYGVGAIALTATTAVIN